MTQNVNIFRQAKKEVVCCMCPAEGQMRSLSSWTCQVFVQKRLILCKKRLICFIYFLRKRLIFLDVIGNTKNSYKMQRLISKKIDFFIEKD